MTKRLTPHSAGLLFAFINCLSLGVLGIIDKLGATKASSPFIFSVQSVLFGLVFVTIFSLLYRQQRFLEDLRNIPRAAWLLVGLVGVGASGLFIILRFLGLTWSTGTFATLSQIITTSLTAVLALFFLRERLSRLFWLLFVVIIIATYFVSVGKFTVASLQIGDAYILLGTIFLACANIFAKFALKYVSPVVLSFGRFLFGGLFVLIIALTFFPAADLLHITTWSILSGLLWTVNVLGFNFAIQKIGVTLTTTILMLAPVLTMTLEHFGLGHNFSLVQVAAAFVVVASGILLVRSKPTQRVV